MIINVDGRHYIMGKQKDGWFALIRDKSGTQTLAQITGIKANNMQDAATKAKIKLYKHRPWLKPKTK